MSTYVSFGPDLMPQDAQERYASFLSYQYNVSGVTSAGQLAGELAAGFITQAQYDLIISGQDVPHLDTVEGGQSA